MKDNVAIKVHNLYKSFELAENKNSSIKQVLVNIGKRHKKQRQKVLDGVDFEINKGEFFGIVGRNGSGKSTLLKLLAGVYTPDQGAVEINGNLTPFIELGVGFNPELTGRDNVYLSASLLGYTHKAVDAMYDEIVAFAELEEHMDKKLKNYSSGMQVRLAFSIAVKAKNDILIFDEVLAVGDEAFQQKCMKVFEGYRDSRQTVILVTHSMDNVRRFCSRALMLSDGKIKLIGPVDRVADAYSKVNLSVTNIDNDETLKAKRMKVVGCRQSYEKDAVMKLKISWHGLEGVCRVGVAIIGANNEYIFGSNTYGMTLDKSFIDYSLKLSLGWGEYRLVAVAYDKQEQIIATDQEAGTFTIKSQHEKNAAGITRLEFEYSNSSKK